VWAREKTHLCFPLVQRSSQDDDEWDVRVRVRVCAVYLVCVDEAAQLGKRVDEAEIVRGLGVRLDDCANVIRACRAPAAHGHLLPHSRACTRTSPTSPLLRTTRTGTLASASHSALQMASTTSGAWLTSSTSVADCSRGALSESNEAGG